MACCPGGSRPLAPGRGLPRGSRMQLMAGDLLAYATCNITASAALTPMKKSTIATLREAGQRLI